MGGRFYCQARPTHHNRVLQFPEGVSTGDPPASGLDVLTGTIPTTVGLLTQLTLLSLRKYLIIDQATSRFVAIKYQMLSHVPPRKFRFQLFDRPDPCRNCFVTTTNWIGPG